MRSKTKPQETQEFTRLSELAKRLRANPATIKRLADAGELPVHAVHVGAATLYRTADVNAWLGAAQ